MLTFETALHNVASSLVAASPGAIVEAAQFAGNQAAQRFTPLLPAEREQLLRIARYAGNLRRFLQDMQLGEEPASFYGGNGVLRPAAAGGSAVRTF